MELEAFVRKLSLPPDGELVREAVVDLLVEAPPELGESLFLSFELQQLRSHHLLIHVGSKDMGDRPAAAVANHQRTDRAKPRRPIGVLSTKDKIFEPDEVRGWARDGCQ
jgi:hypothetical protein